MSYYKYNSRTSDLLKYYYGYSAEDENKELRNLVGNLREISVEYLEKNTELKTKISQLEKSSVVKDNEISQLEKSCVVKDNEISRLERDNVKLTNQVTELAKQLSSSYLEKPEGYVDQQTNENPCVCCLANKRCVAFATCGHLCVCSSCSSAFKKRRVCPICNTVNTGLTFIYQ